MISHLSVCGDSFGVGAGISMDPHVMFNSSFGGIVSKDLNIPLKLYARSGCCNFVIYLQVKKIIEQYRENNQLPLVLITTTHHSRFCFPIDIETNFIEYDLSDVDYLTYSPFVNKEDYKNILPFTLKESPKLISETISNVIYHTSTPGSSLANLFARISSKLSIIKRYVEYLYSDSIKLTTDHSLITIMHLELAEAGIPHLIMAYNPYHTRFVKPENFFCQDWGYYSSKYPDQYKSGHCTAAGHLETANKLIEKIKLLNLT